MRLHTIMAVAAGAAVGASLRYAITLWAAARWGAGFPYGTLIINTAGSLAIGALAELAQHLRFGEALRLLLITGLLGGFTTFSAFSYETYALLLAGRWLAALAYVAASVLAGLSATFLGAALVRAGA